jgi:hypothetical protein
MPLPASLQNSHRNGGTVFSSSWRMSRTVRLCRFWHRYVRAGFVWQLAADRGRSRMPHDFRRYDGEKLERQHVPVSHQL